MHADVVDQVLGDDLFHSYGWLNSSPCAGGMLVLARSSFSHSPSCRRDRVLRKNRSNGFVSCANLIASIEFDAHGRRVAELHVQPMRLRMPSNNLDVSRMYLRLSVLCRRRPGGRRCRRLA